MVFLPGIGDVLEDYEFHGFVEAVRQNGVPADMIVADMHFGYYVRQTAVERLRQDVIVPAQDRGYREIDLIGISLGGFGALIYAMHYPRELARLFLLAPYLGERLLVEEMAQAGGAKKWRPKVAADDYQRRLWLWLKDYAVGSRDFPALYLGYGLQDKFAAANRLLAELLPPPHRCTIPGKHDWTTWSRLWNLMLARIADDFSNVRAHSGAVSKEP